MRNFRVLKLVKKPTYSSELNASEQVGRYLKNILFRNKAFKNIKAPVENLTDALKKNTNEIRDN